MSKANVKKVVVLGEGRVGKTSLTLRYCKGEYKDDQESTINASFLEKKVPVGDNDESVNLAIWDTAGQEKFRSIAPMYYQSAQCAIIVYDITFKESFDKVKSWVQELQNVLDTSQVTLCIVGNKCDMEISRQIDKKTAEDYALSVGAKHFLTSAKNNKGIDDLFQYVAQEIQKKKRGKRTGGGGVMILSSATKPKKDKSCCGGK